MKTKNWSLFVLLFGLLGLNSLTGAASEGPSDAMSVQQMISQLGDEQYVVRQRAETQLLERGVEAFAELQKAKKNTDLEISTRAKYLFTQINITWVLPSDPAIVRSIMAHFGELPRQEKLAKIIKLSELDKKRGFSALRRIAKYESSGLITRYTLYHFANAQTKQGNLKEAGKLSLQALQIEVPEVNDRNIMAGNLSEIGRHDWAEREWEWVIKKTDETDLVSLSARQSLALFRLHDRLEHKAAADLLTESIDAINADPKVKEEFLGDKWSKLTLERFRANREYLLACHEECQGHYGKERRHLEQAIRLEEDNADFLIAMFHSAERTKSRDADDAYRENAQKQLDKARGKLEKEIRSISQLPATQQREAGYLAAIAQRHNHWAWLVSNTEGDFKKAVQHSKLSLKFAPGSPSYLDTLGRCYYAAGELDNAIKVQREAIEKHPHMLVMQRQLKFFEGELQKRQGDKVGE